MIYIGGRRHLEIFTEVCRQMNMRKTAEVLMISQSSVSQAVSSLEKEFGVVLFERLNHKLYLTREGQELLYLAEQVLRSAKQLVRRMQGAESRNVLRLGVCTTVGSCLAWPLTDACRQEQDIDFRVEVANSKSLEKRLLNARLDLAVIQAGKISHYLECIPLLQDELTLIAWPGHPLAGRKVPLASLSEENFVVREKGSGTQILLEQTFAGQNLRLKKRWTCNSPEAVRQAVQRKCGIALISRFLIHRELLEGSLSEIIPEENLFGRQFVLTYHKDKLQDQCFQGFVRFCRRLGMEGIREMILRDAASHITDTEKDTAVIPDPDRLPAR